MPEIDIDPTTRIEGHHGITLQVDDAGTVTEAKSKMEMFRGAEIVTLGRPPSDAPQITGMVCGVCFLCHRLCSSKAAEDAAMNSPDVDFGEDDWWHGHVSNARVVWDADAELLLEATVGGEPIDPEARYTVAVSEYLLHSDHEFPTLAQRHRIDEGDIQYEVLADYAREHGIDPRIEGRIEIRNRKEITGENR